MCNVWPQPSSGPGLARRGQRPRCIQISLVSDVLLPLHNDGYFCSLGPHLEKTNKMITYDDQTSQDVSTTPVLRVCTCHVIIKKINA